MVVPAIASTEHWCHGFIRITWANVVWCRLASPGFTTCSDRIEVAMPDVTLSIDGKRVVVEQGTTVLRAALANGIEIPVFCYHPALSIEGSCRACLVRVERLPRLQTACSTVCTDGMVVHTTDPEAVKARAMVIEFLLLNHPLDCP
jgi:predicted molibdopterin-dependent oxidoreductase YjgC